MNHTLMSMPFEVRFRIDLNLPVAVEVSQATLVPEAPLTAPSVLKQVLKECFQYHPDKRPTMAQICDELDNTK